MATKKTAARAPTYTMPQEVSDWIEHASSRLSYLQSEVDRLKRENNDLKAYKKFAEERLLRYDKE